MGTHAAEQHASSMSITARSTSSSSHEAAGFNAIDLGGLRQCRCAVCVCVCVCVYMYVYMYVCVYVRVCECVSMPVIAQAI